jgi:hypothetical protein
LSTVPRGDIAFLDAAGTCLILVKRNPPINPLPDNHGGAHHSFAVEHDEYKAAFDHLRAHGVEITFEEDRQGGVHRERGMEPERFRNRTDAGRQLAEKLAAYANRPDVLVLALP